MKLCSQPVDVGAYRAEAEAFMTSIEREYYLQLSGRQEEFEIEPIYERHAALFTREAVEELRDQGERVLLEFAAEGHIGQATKSEAAELARREAALEIEVDGRRVPFRQAAVLQGNESDPAGRAALEDARNKLVSSELDPLLRESHERTAALARDLGWRSVRHMSEDLSGIDLGALREQTAAFLRASDDRYEELVEPALRDELSLGFGELQRADLPAFFRAASLDALFPEERLVESLRETLRGLGIDADAQANVVLDTEDRPTKSPRAFCAPVRVPDEVYLVIARHGGRDDYEALFHEAGHAQHFGHMDAALPFEQRFLGDNSVTESFAFLLQHLTEDAEWLRRRLGVEDAGEVIDKGRAAKLVFLRRYAAKLDYELELHSEDAALDEMPRAYAGRLSDAVRVDWPEATWLSDVDSFFYAARYLRAWALETHLRRELGERFGPDWFERPAAGRFLVDLWRHGQRDDADTLLRDLTGSRLDFSAMLADLGLAQP